LGPIIQGGIRTRGDPGPGEEIRFPRVGLKRLEQISGTGKQEPGNTGETGEPGTRGDEGTGGKRGNGGHKIPENTRRTGRRGHREHRKPGDQATQGKAEKTRTERSLLTWEKNLWAQHRDIPQKKFTPGENIFFKHGG